MSEGQGDAQAASTAVNLLIRPAIGETLDLPLPGARRLLEIWVGAIAIGSTAAAVGAYYITLTIEFSPAELRFFLIALLVAVTLSIALMLPVHLRLTKHLGAWLRAPEDVVPHAAWREALNYPVRMAVALGAAAIAVSLTVAASTALVADELRVGAHIGVGGLLAALLDAVFAWLFMDWRMREVLRPMAARNYLLPVSGQGIVSLGLALKMAIVIVVVSLVGAVVSGTLAYRGAAKAVATGDVSGLATQLSIVTLIGLLVSLSGCLLVARRTTGTLAELRETVQAAGPGRPSARALPSDADEVGQLMSSFNQMLDGLDEREFLADAFSRYVTPQVSDSIRQGGISMGGEQLVITVLLADIRDFTPLTEQLPPRALVRLLNRYFEVMVEVCVEQGGMIDKFIGDAIMVVFGAPQPVPAAESAARAAQAALAMQERLVQLNERFTAEELPTLRIGIGIHTGEAVAGNIGATQRLDYTVIGDTVNLCARIEASCKPLGERILISSTTRELLGERAEVGEAHDIVLRGKSQATRLFALHGLRS